MQIILCLALYIAAANAGFLQLHASKQISAPSHPIAVAAPAPQYVHVVAVPAPQPVVYAHHAPVETIHIIEEAAPIVHQPRTIRIIEERAQPREEVIRVITEDHGYHHHASAASHHAPAASHHVPSRAFSSDLLDAGSDHTQQLGSNGYENRRRRI